MENTLESNAELTQAMVGLLNVEGRLKLPPQAIERMVEAFGSQRVRKYLLELSDEAPIDRAAKVRDGLRASVICYCEEVIAVLTEAGKPFTERHLLRALKSNLNLVHPLERILIGQSDCADIQHVWNDLALVLNDAPADTAIKEPKPAQAAHAAPPKQVAPVKAEQSKREEFAVYATSGALNFEICTNRSGKLALNVDATQSNGIRSYDWTKKIIVQLSEKEMLLLYAVLRGFMTTFEAKSHGASNQKAFSIQAQASNFYVKVQERARPLVTVPVPPADAAMLVMLIGRALVANQPVLGSLEGVDVLVKPITQMMLAEASRA
jgi:hypothetical protein